MGSSPVAGSWCGLGPGRLLEETGAPKGGLGPLGLQVSDPVDEVAILVWSLRGTGPLACPSLPALLGRTPLYQPGPGLGVRGGHIIEMQIFSQRYPHFRVSQPSGATPSPSGSF